MAEKRLFFGFIVFFAKYLQKCRILGYDFVKKCNVYSFVPLCNFRIGRIYLKFMYMLLQIVQHFFTKLLLNFVVHVAFGLEKKEVFVRVGFLGTYPTHHYLAWLMRRITAKSFTLT